ncbi:MAG: metal-dependent transcriptional regulator [Ruminococcaceae bacterium]|nr:metal-dependent transcriptional regulator [Oscillospiraceae bacterium]
MQLQESGEMYLESILVLSEKKGIVRSIDVCEYMGFSKPSVSRAIHLLEDGGYLKLDEKGSLKLTEVGLEVAKKIYERHRVLTEILCYLGVDRETATDDACRMEHIISDQTFEVLKARLAHLNLF